MKLIDVFLASGLLLSISGNIALAFILLKSKKKRPLAVDAAEILNDLTIAGQALVRVVRIDPNDFLLRSPRR